jgi:hypothetical protein
VTANGGIAAQVQQIFRKATRRDRSPRMVRFLLTVTLLEDRGGLPQGTGEPPRPVWAQVREIAVPLERLGEMIEWNRPLADAVLAGQIQAHRAIMMMLRQRGYYRGKFEALRYQGDQWVRRRIDRTVDARR